MKTIDAANSASCLYFWQRIMDMTAAGCAASNRTIPRSMPWRPNAAAIMNPRAKPPAILRSDAAAAVFKEVTLILVKS